MPNSKLCWPVLLLAGTLSGCAWLQPDAVEPPPPPQYSALEREAETQRLHQWLDARYEEYLQAHPLQLSYLGRKERYDQVDDMSEAAQQRELAWLADTVERMGQAFDYARLSAEGRMSFDAWVYQYEQERASAPWRRHAYLFEQEGGSQTLPANFLINYHKVDTAADMRAYILRIAGFSRGLAQLLYRAQAAAEDGIRPPRFAYDGAIEQARKIITGLPFNDSTEDAALWSDAQGKIAALLSDGRIDREQAAALRRDARAALMDALHPAYLALIEWLEQDRAEASPGAQGASALPRGAEYYAQRLRASTTTELSAREIHELGLQEVQRIREEMQEIRQALGFSGDLTAFFRFLREDPRFYYPNTDAGRTGYLEDTRGFLAAIEARLPRYFGLLPGSALQVKRVEAYREVDGAAQHYFPGTPDGSRPGVYYAHLSDMSAYSRIDMETTAYHEGLPGHHMQISIAQERQDLPQFRSQAHFTAYVEGWALYAEALAGEMGAYADPYNRMGHLNAEMWRAIRLVVDTGLHALGWSEAQAVDFFLANSAIPEAAVRSEVRRYLVWPGQATSYKVGMLKIQELRRKASQALGERFDIRGFHDTVLGGGALPLSLLERRVEQWIAARRTHPAS